MTRRRTTGRRLAAVVPATLLALVVMGAPSALANPGTGKVQSAAATTAASDHAAKGKSADHAKTTSANDNSQAADHATKGTAGTSGDPTTPQPLSRADKNSGGANGQCTGATYCSTRDGSPSGNGNGGGKATGKPCAGCVGKADNKNPPGQEKTDPRGTFPNNGYECDNNNGIGKTNPAHTGCTGTTPPPCPSSEVMNDSGDCVPTSCPSGEVMNDSGDCVPTSCPSGEVMSDSGDCVPPSCDATGEDCGSNPPPQCVPTAANNFCSTVEGEHHSRNPQTQKPTTKVLGEKVVRTPGSLPFTGASGLGFLLATAAITLGVGSGLSVAARRRRRAG